MSNKLDISLDLEALGKPPHPVILSIGAVTIDREKERVTRDMFYENISVASCLSEGLTIDDDTMDWWLSQDKQAWSPLFIPPHRHIREVMHRLREYCDNGILWAHQTYDTFILNGVTDLLGLKPIVHYRNQRDLRTLYDLAGGRPKVENPNKHNALADAQAQAQEILACFKAMGEEE